MLRAYLSLFDVKRVKADETEMGKWLQGMNPVLFENGGRFRSVGNLWASRDRIAAAFHTQKEELCTIVSEAVEHPVPCRDVGSIENAPVLTNFIDVNMEEFPIPLCTPVSVAAAGVIISEYGNKKSMQACHVTRLAKKEICVEILSDHVHSVDTPCEADLPVAICTGVCPSLLLGAAASTEYEIDGLAVASALRNRTLGEPVYTVAVDGLHVPAFSEFALMGRITSTTFGKTYGDTAPDKKRQILIDIDRIYHADDPLMHFLLPGGYEYRLLRGIPRESAIYTRVRQAVPHVGSVRLTKGGCNWLHSVVSITSEKRDDSVRAVQAAFAGHPPMKQVIIVDEDIDIFDDTCVEWAVATRFCADIDLVHKDTGRVDLSGTGSPCSLGVDATRPPGKDTPGVTQVPHSTCEEGS
jgi:UbiD family decarboxylase